MMIDIRYLAWMAGIVEMRGRITRDRHHSRVRPRVRLGVSGHQLATIQRLCDLTGVEIDAGRSRQIITSDRKGCSEHCPDAHVHVKAEIPAMLTWTLTGVAVAVILHNLMPYMVEDHDYDQVIADATRDLPGPRERGGAAIARSIYLLHRLGWDIPEDLTPYLTYFQGVVDAP